MKIKRDYSQPFFRDPKRHPIRNMLIAALLGLLIGLGVLSQWDAVEDAADVFMGNAPTPTPLPSELATRATRLIQSGELEEAADLLEKVVLERPDNPAYLFEYGTVLMDIERYEEAYALGEQIIDLNARDVRGFALEALSLVWQNKYSAAIPIALSGLELNPRFTMLYTALARAYVGTSKWGDGLDMAERGLSIDPNDASLVRAYAYALQSVAEYEQAASYLEQAIELRPSFLPAYFELAGLYLSQNQDQSAIDMYNRILSIDPRNARAMLRQCLAYRKVGEFARALGFCEDSIVNDDTDPEALFQLGLLYYRERRFQESLDAFAQCVEHDVGTYDLSCMYRLGLSYYYTGDCDTGWEYLQDSLLMAQAREDGQVALDNIRLGLSAISTDPNCPDYSGRFPTPLPPPEETAETEEAGA
jgi:tetratricopeptide (TPR) repeat protein